MTVEAEGEAPEQGEGQSEPRQLREALDRKTTEAAAQADLIKDMAFKLAGVDITKGIGKTARSHYDGELSEEAIRDYMRDSFEWTGPQQTPPGQVLGQQIAEAQNRIQDTGQGPGTQSGNNEASLQVQIDEAEAKGDWKTAMAKKKEWFGQLMFGNRR
jgi:hypothetical protein